MEQTVTGERPVFRKRQLFGGRSIAFPYVVAKRVGAGLKGNVRLMASFGTVLLILALAVACMPPAASPGDSKTATGEAPVPTHEATAEATAEDTSPPGDCWGGALSEDPLHCYVVEQAQVAGEIVIEAIYEAANDVLHVFLRGSESLDRSLAASLEEKAHEFLNSPQGIDLYADTYWAHECGTRPDHSDREWRACTLGFVDFKRVAKYEPGEFVPPVSSYGQIYLHVGGIEARRSIAGWPSWRQVWPAAASQPGPRDTSGIDVSDVDTTSIPEPDCELLGAAPFTNSACWA